MTEMSSKRKFAVEAIGKQFQYSRFGLIPALLLLVVVSATAQMTAQRQSSGGRSSVAVTWIWLSRSTRGLASPAVSAARMRRTSGQGSTWANSPTSLVHGTHLVVP